MSESETDYFIIEGGPALKIFDAWNVKRVAQTKKRRAFFKKHKCGRRFYGGSDSCVLGLTFDHEPDQELWRRDGRSGYWVPRKTTPEGKVLTKEMHSLGDPSFTEMTKEIVGIGHLFYGMKVYHGGMDWLNGKPVLHMPNPFGDKPRPETIDKAGHYKRGCEYKLMDGVRQLKRSEYWALKEAEKIPRLRKKKAKAS